VAVATPPPADVTPVPVAPVAPVEVVVIAPKTNPVVVAQPVVIPVLSREQIAATVDRLVELSHSTDPQAVYTALLDTTNAEKEIRLAALEAVKQLGNQDTVPAIQQMITNCADADMRSGLTQASDFLTLPKLTDANLPVGTSQRETGLPRHLRNQTAAP
jgi:hypothetical protein